MSMTSSAYCCCLFLFSLSVATFYTSLSGDFAFDDRPAILQNDDVASDTSFNVFLHDFWGENITDASSHKSYRPLTVLTFKLNRWLFPRGAAAAAAFHVVNVFLHAFNSVLVYLYVRIVATEAACLSAVLFAVHPVHVECVAGIVGRADLLYTLCTLSALITAEGGSAVANGLLAAVATLFKEQGIMLLPLVTAHQTLFEHRLRIAKSKVFRVKVSRWRSLKRKFVLNAVSTVFILLFRFWIMGFRAPKFQPGDNPAAFADCGELLRHVNFQLVYAINFLLLLSPHWLCFDWSMGCVRLVDGLSDFRIVGILAFWTVLCLLAARASKNRPVVAMSLALLILPFLPCSNLLFVVGFVVAERNLYLPSLGTVILTASGFASLVRRFPRYKVALIASVAFLVAVHGWKSHERSKEWNNEETLFVSGLGVCPENAKVYYNIGKVKADAGNGREAETFYRKAIDLWPSYEHALNNLGNLMRKKSAAEGKRLLLKAVEINPGFAAAWMNLGIVQAQLNDLSLAEMSYTKAILLRKRYPDAHFNLGTLYLKMGAKEKALAEFSVAIAQNFRHFSAWSNKVILLDEMGRFGEAEEVAIAGTKAFPNKPDFYFHLGNACGKIGRFEEASRYYSVAIGIDPNVSLYHLNLGVLYHRWKRYEDAAVSYCNALDVDPSNEKAERYLISINSLLNAESPAP